MAEGKDTIQLEFTPEEKTLLAGLEAKHGRIFPFRVKGHGLFVVRKPLRAEWRKYLQDSRRPEVDKVLLDEALFKTLTVVPDLAAVDRMLDDYPNMVEPYESMVRGLATGSQNEIILLGKDWKAPDATI